MASVIDLETSVDNLSIGNNKASPFYPDNQVVMAGECDIRDGEVSIEVGCVPYVPYGATIIGQNVKFDLHYLRREWGEIHWRNWLLAGGSVWDTQLAEYLITGQDHKYASLDDLATKYGGTLKIDVIKEMWNSGVRTEDIDKDLLEEYLIGDVTNTRIVAEGQAKSLHQPLDMQALARSQMDALLAIQEIEYNGMHVDQDQIEHLYQGYSKILEDLDQELKQMVIDDLATLSALGDHRDAFLETLNLGSTHQLSKIIFGGGIPYKVSEQCGLYKSGKKKGEPKYKKVEYFAKFYGSIKLDKYKQEMAREGVYKVDDAVLQDIVYDKPTGKKLFEILSGIIEHRKLRKEVTTYYGALRGLVFPDGKVHANINQCATHTGRLSSNNPNSQNYPSHGDSKVKTVFTSRWGDKGKIVEADYKQLEVIALAYLTRDPTLMDDICTGKDMHYETGKKVFGWKDPSDMDKDSRTIVKRVNFSLIYGGTPKGIAKSVGCSLSIADACVNAFYARYPEVQVWQDRIYAEVTDSRAPSSRTTSGGYPAGVGKYTSVTGRVYTFYEYDVPWDAGSTNFSPTQTKNYPVQGLATGDIMQLVMGKLLRALKKDALLHDECLMVGQVHDAILFDVYEDNLEYALEFIRDIMEKAPQYFEETFGMPFDLPLKVDIGVGNNWKEAA